MGLHIVKSPSMHVSGFTDAHSTGCIDDRRSTGGFAIFLDSNLVSWSARKQPMVSRLSIDKAIYSKSYSRDHVDTNIACRIKLGKIYCSVDMV
jgi:hypothetical protein